MGVFPTVGHTIWFISVQTGQNGACDHPTQIKLLPPAHVQFDVTKCVYMKSKLRVFTLTVSVPQTGPRGYFGKPRAPLNHRTSEKPGPVLSSAINNVYCSRSERMLRGILKKTNTPQGINTGSPPRPPHRKKLSLCWWDSWKHTCHTTSTLTAPYSDMCQIQDIRSGGLHFLNMHIYQSYINETNR